jgi:hypothetical protein
MDRITFISVGWISEDGSVRIIDLDAAGALSPGTRAGAA